MDRVSDRIDCALADAHAPSPRGRDSKEGNGGNHSFSLPQYYGVIYRRNWGCCGKIVKGILYDLLCNTLAISDGVILKAGQDSYKDSFLCGWINADKMPWDLNQEGW